MPNHLIHETSPYLQQHADNPVDWYPWGKEALSKAQREGKPILLSIGYAACHWCHVMAHESFADKATADLMNELFVNIKVDREERPDIDKIYQAAHYLLTRQSGGWPLTVFLTPDDLAPFFSGTYFPPEARYQLPAFKDILRKLAKIYREKPKEIKRQNEELIQILKPRPPVISDVRLNEQPLQHALQTLQNNFDPINGGLGPAPKFPQTPKLELLLYLNSPMASFTLKQMGKGGIYDQLAGGFYRYAVDDHWRIPHFEKMLYDNGHLLFLYTIASKQYADPFFAKIALETAEWLIANMQAEHGGYYASLDADSEGREGKFYVWDKQKIKKILSPDEFKIINLYYGLNEAPNFENEWHFYITAPLQEVADNLNLSLDKATDLVHTARKKLRHERDKRIPPALDHKILTAWNSLTIKGMLVCGSLLNEPRFTASAYQALTFIKEKLWLDNRLLATNKAKNKINAYLDDYAFLLDALLTALQISWKNEYILFAMKLADHLLEYFFDENQGGFYFTAKDHEKLLYRPKVMMDEVIPSGNGVAARVLLLLGHLLGEPRYLHAAEKTFQASWPSVTSYPAEHCSLLLGINEYLHPPKIVIIRGPIKEIKVWHEVASQSKNNYVFSIPAGEELPGLLALKESLGKTVAYICQGMHCSEPIQNLNLFKEKMCTTNLSY